MGGVLLWGGVRWIALCTCPFKAGEIELVGCPGRVSPGPLSLQFAPLAVHRRQAEAPLELEFRFLGASPTGEFCFGSKLWFPSLRYPLPSASTSTSTRVGQTPSTLNNECRQILADSHLTEVVAILGLHQSAERPSAND